MSTIQPGMGSPPPEFDAAAPAAPTAPPPLEPTAPPADPSAPASAPLEPPITRLPSAPARPQPPVPASAAAVLADSGVPAIDEERRGLVAAIRAEPAWGAVPPGTKAAIESVLLSAGNPQVAAELKALIGQSGFATRLSPLAQLSLVDIVRRNPGGAAAVNRNYAELSRLLDGPGYERLAPEDQEKTLRLLAEKPFVGKPLTLLLENSTFRGLSQADKTAVFDRIDRAPANEATGTVAHEYASLLLRAYAANGKANEILDLLRIMEKGESLSIRNTGVLGELGRLVHGDWAALGAAPLGNWLLQGKIKDRVVELLSGPDANDVYRALEEKGEGRIHDLMEQLIEDPDEGDTRARLVKIMRHLDPDNAAKFISNLSYGIGKELQKENLFDAVAKGFSLSGTVDGAEIAVSGNGVSVGVPSMNVYGHSVKDLKLAFDPGPLRAALANKKDKDYRNLLTEVLDSFTKNHELMSSAERWGDREKREYFDAIKRLPGGGGASDLTAPVATPTFRNPGGVTPGATPP